MEEFSRPSCSLASWPAWSQNGAGPKYISNQSLIILAFGQAQTRRTAASETQAESVSIIFSAAASSSPGENRRTRWTGPGIRVTETVEVLSRAASDGRAEEDAGCKASAASMEGCDPLPLHVLVTCFNIRCIDQEESTLISQCPTSSQVAQCDAKRTLHQQTGRATLCVCLPS